MNLRDLVFSYVKIAVFCIFLFYLSAVLVSNFAFYAENETLYGFNPMLAFKSYLIPTIVLFFFILSIIITSLKSYFLNLKNDLSLNSLRKNSKNDDKKNEI